MHSILPFLLAMVAAIVLLEMWANKLKIQRQYLVELNKDPKIDEEMIRQQLYQIDLEEERLKII